MKNKTKLILSSSLVVATGVIAPLTPVATTPAIKSEVPETFPPGASFFATNLADSGSVTEEIKIGI